MTYSIPLVTRCTVCRETLLIQRDTAAVGYVEHCVYCGTPALIQFLIDGPSAALKNE